MEDNKTLNRQPFGLYPLAIAESLVLFSYYGTLMALVLYLTEVFHFSTSKSFAIYGAFAWFVYAMPIPGGLLGDRILGMRYATVIGAIALVIGNLIVLQQTLTSFYIGLALIIIGIAFFKPNCTSLVGTLYNHDDPGRERGYVIFYLGMNIGSVLGAILFGLSADYFGWNSIFIISASVIFIALIVLLASFKNRITTGAPVHPHLIKKQLAPLINVHRLTYIGIFVATATMLTLFYHTMLLNGFLIVLATAMLITLGIITAHKHGSERKRVISLLILSALMMVFYSATIQVGSSISLFIKYHVYHIVVGWKIPTVMMTALYPLGVLISAPFINRLWRFLKRHGKEPTAPLKFVIGLTLASLGFFILLFAINSTAIHRHNDMALIWIVLTNFCFGAGELCIIPTIFTAISVLAPKDLRSTLVGSSYLFVAFGSYISSGYAKLSTVEHYRFAFTTTAVITLAIAITALLLAPKIKRLMAGK